MFIVNLPIWVRIEKLLVLMSCFVPKKFLREQNEDFAFFCINASVKYLYIEASLFYFETRLLLRYVLVSKSVTVTS